MFTTRMLARLGRARGLPAKPYHPPLRCLATASQAATTESKADTPKPAPSIVDADQPFRFSGLIPERTERRQAAESSTSNSSQSTKERRPLSLPSLFKDDLSNTLNPNNRSTASRGPFASYSGRTKPVLNGDIVGAFRQLGSVLKQNNVMREFKQQKFYEKPSDKRGRLSRERHRKRFLVGVRRLVGLVKEQRKFQ